MSKCLECNRELPDGGDPDYCIYCWKSVIGGDENLWLGEGWRKDER